MEFILLYEKLEYDHHHIRLTINNGNLIIKNGDLRYISFHGPRYISPRCFLLLLHLYLFAPVLHLKYTGFAAVIELGPWNGLPVVFLHHRCLMFFAGFAGVFASH